MGIRAIGYHVTLSVLKGLGLSALLVLASAAAPRSDAEIFAAYIKSPHHRAFLQSAFNQAEPPPLKVGCPTENIVSLDPPLVIQPAEFAQIGNDYPISVGRWVQRATLDHCGAPVTRRLYLVADPRTGDLHAFGLLPGEFPGNLQLEGDARRIVLGGMMAVAHCRDPNKVFVLDTRLTSPAVARGWSESWTAQVCGRTVTADVSYAEDATGMNVTARNLRLR